MISCEAPKVLIQSLRIVLETVLAVMSSITIAVGYQENLLMIDIGTPDIWVEGKQYQRVDA